MKTLMYVTILSVSGLLLSCNEDKKDSDTTSTTTTTGTDSSSMHQDTTAKETTGTPITDTAVTAFVKSAAMDGMMEAEMGKMAADGSDSTIKNFGAMMASDHTTATNELKKMAAENSIDIPSAVPPSQPSEMKMKGASSNKTYISKMIKDHEKLISKYKKASASLTNPAYKAYAEKMLPILQKHLDSALALQKRIK